MSSGPATAPTTPGMAEPAGGHAAEPTILGLDSYAVVGLAFAAFVLLLWRLGAFAMIARALDARAEKVRSDLAEAAALKAEAEAMRAAAAAAAAEAEASARAMIASAEAEAARILAGVEAEAEAAIARRIRLAEDRIAAEARAAEDMLRARAADLAVAAARSIIEARQDDLAPLTDAAIEALDRR